MFTIERSRAVHFGSVVVFALTLLVPASALAEDDAAAPALAVAPSAAVASGPDSPEQRRAIAAGQALQSGDLGSMQEEALAELAVAEPSWGETSGYDAVEASRASASGLMAPASDGRQAVAPAQDDPLARFRAIELAGSRSIGAAPQGLPSCGIDE
jgi:hypothetical protein